MPALRLPYLLTAERAIKLRQTCDTSEEFGDPISAKAPILYVSSVTLSLKTHSQPI